MNLRSFILGTVAANLALVGLLLWQAARSPSPAVLAGLSVTTNVIAEVVNETPAPLPVVKVAGSPPFQWHQLETTNHLRFATNLLAIGCPKETVRDMVEARIADDFRARRRELLRPLNARFWDAMADDTVNKLFDGTPTEKAVNELKAEGDRMLAQLEALVGKEAPTDKPGRNETLGHLPAVKQAAVATLEARQVKERGGLESEVKKLPSAERTAKQKELNERLQAERRALYTDAEWSELQLRYHSRSVNVRELRGFDATPEELRSLAKVLQDFDTTHPLPTPRDRKRPNDDPDYQAKVSERDAQQKTLLTERLGEAGYAAFERGSDPRFHTLLKLSRRLELTPAVAVQWLDLQTAAQNQAQQARQNPDLTDDARAVALLAIRVETERTLKAAVGQRGWGAYRRYAGDWLESSLR
jgi:hypothetical protein